MYINRYKPKLLNSFCRVELDLTSTYIVYVCHKLKLTWGAIPTSRNKGPMTNPEPVPRRPPTIPDSREQMLARNRWCNGQCVC